jgi:DNA-binding NarL/FixJ family response regulator
VKTEVAGIYRKLAVTNRAQAVRKALDIGILRT